MQAFNFFALQSEQRLRKLNLTDEQRRRILTRVLQDINEMDILTSIGYSFLFDDDEPGDVVVPAQYIEQDRESLIAQKQVEYGIEPNPPAKVNSEFKWGRKRLHEAVVIGDEDSIRRFIAEGDNPNETDNNRNTPYDLALLNDKQDIMKLLKELGAAV